MSRFLRQRQNTRVTTLIDLYGIGKTMLELATGNPSSSAGTADAIEAAIATEFGNTTRLIPYIQVHEFEALLFTDLAAFERGTGHAGAASALIEGGLPLPPEEVNGTRPPSKRILECFADYDKVNDGTLAAQAIGIETMRERCPRFDAWLIRLGM